jgi:hypothetical protein
MGLSDQFLGQVRNNPLGTPIKLRRAALVQRCSLCNSHLVAILCEAGQMPNGSAISISLRQVGYLIGLWAMEKRSAREMIAGDINSRAQR